MNNDPNDSAANVFQFAVAISGGGTTLRNLIEWQQAGKLKAKIGLVISSNHQAAGLQFAKQAGIETAIFDYREFKTAASISDVMFDACRKRKMPLLAMGGFLRKVLIPPDFRNRVINIHPSLIPAYCGKGMYGMRVHRAVIENGSAISGCTVHFVDDQFDHGPIVAQESVPVEQLTAEELQKRVFEKECQLYPQVINAIAEGRVNVVGELVSVKPS